MKNNFKTGIICLVRGLLLFFPALLTLSANAQTPGVIYDRATSTAGRLVLDRNGDGYTSATTAGFTSNDITQSEMIFTPVPQLSLEPNGDVVTAPSCGFTDFTDNSITHDAVGVHLDSNNTYLVFRFRMSNASNNSKGYSVLIDADSKFGNTGPYADPNYIAPTSSSFGNPGFEIEVLLATNFGVYVYNVDGLSTPGAAVTSYPGHTNYQKSVAYNTNCSQAYFLDFYVKVSDLPSPYNNLTTGFRYAVNTVTSPHSALQGPISDVGGVNDALFSDNYASIWSNVINAQTSTTLTNVTSMASVVQPPTVKSPLYTSSTSILVTNNDLATGYLEVYRKRSGTTTLLGTISSVASGATGTLSSVTLAAGDSIWAKDSISSTDVSLVSNKVNVTSLNCNKPTAPLVTCYSGKGVNGTTTYSGATIKAYSVNGTLVSSFTGLSTGGSPYSWGLDPTKSGNTNNACGTGSPSGNVYGALYFTVTVNGCESDYTYSTNTSSPCVNSSTPTVTFFNYSTGVISGTSTGASDSISIFKNGKIYAKVKASSNAWSYTGTSSSFLSSDTVLVGEYTAYTSCVSSKVLALVAPVVSSPIASGATTVSGTSTAPAGTYIKVYKVGTSQSIGSTTVSSTGTWSATVSALTAGNQIEAFDSTAGYKSAVSNIVTVSAAATSITATITGSYTENGTSVTGTISSSSTGTLTLYEDGTAIGTAAISASTSWTVTGLSSTKTTSLDNYLYAGAYLTAKFTPTGGTEGTNANTVAVGCQMPSTAKTITATKYKFCSSEYPAVTIASSEAGVIYTMVNHNTSTTISPSMVGTGGTITLTGSSALSSSKIIDVTSLKISPVSCSNTQSDTAYLREDCDASYGNASYSSGHVFNNGDVVATVTDPDGTITSATISSGSLPPGTSFNSSTGQITVTNNGILVSGSWPLTVNTADNHTFTNGTGQTVYGTSSPTVTISFVSPLPVTLVSFTGKKEGNVAALDWTTASEYNNAGFEVERSLDGAGFNTIGYVKGHGTTNTMQQYSFDDKEPVFGTSYYRLKQVDYNGAFEYSKIVAIHDQSNKGISVNAYPNPIAQPDKLHVEISNQAPENVTIELCDMSGRIIYTIPATEVQGMKTEDLSIQGLHAGMYLLRVIASSDVLITKVQVTGK